MTSVYAALNLRLINVNKGPSKTTTAFHFILLLFELARVGKQHLISKQCVISFQKEPKATYKRTAHWISTVASI